MHCDVACLAYVLELCSGWSLYQVVVFDLGRRGQVIGKDHSQPDFGCLLAFGMILLTTLRFSLTIVIVLTISEAISKAQAASLTRHRSQPPGF